MSGAVIASAAWEPCSGMKRTPGWTAKAAMTFACSGLIVSIVVLVKLVLNGIPLLLIGQTCIVNRLRDFESCAKTQDGRAYMLTCAVRFVRGIAVLDVRDVPRPVPGAGGGPGEVRASASIRVRQ